MVASAPVSTLTEPVPKKPKLGFLGVGWIGKSRMKALENTGLVEIALVCDNSPKILEEIRREYPKINVTENPSGFADHDLDGLVIATPSALHAEQCIQALEQGLHVFCQKPLGRNAAEVRKILQSARRNNRLIGVDFSYRHTAGLRKLKEIIDAESLGKIFAGEFIFHNAYGPDKSWFYNPKLSGGGCAMDLGIHLVDLALWLFDFPKAQTISSSVFANGSKNFDRANKVEDFMSARLELTPGPTLDLSCSWKISAGADAIISVQLFGTEGGVRFSNVNGSFYDFQLEIFRGRNREVLVSPPDDWSGRAAVAWFERFRLHPEYDPDCEKLIRASETLDEIYRCAR